MSYILIIAVLVIGAVVFFATQTEAPTTTTEVENVEVIEVEADQEVKVDDETTDVAAVEVGSEIVIEETTTEEESTEPVAEELLDTEVEAEAAVSIEADTTQTLSGTGAYLTPRREEHEIDVTLTLDGDIITVADVAYDGSSAATANHIAFDNAYEAEVIGQNVTTLELSRTGGASLTSDAFNEAVSNIVAQL